MMDCSKKTTIMRTSFYVNKALMELLSNSEQDESKRNETQKTPLEGSIVQTSVVKRHSHHVNCFRYASTIGSSLRNFSPGTSS